MQKKSPHPWQDYLKNLTPAESVSSDPSPPEDPTPAPKSLSLPPLSFPRTAPPSAIDTSNANNTEVPLTTLPTESLASLEVSSDRPVSPKSFPRRLGVLGVVAAVVGGTALMVPWLIDRGQEWQQTAQLQRYEQEYNQDSEVLRLALLPPKDRAQPLQAIANSAQASLERSRARYLLAGDLLANYEGGPAVRLLENLEQDYPVMAPYILLMRGRGYQLANEPDQAKETWQKILTEFPDSPVKVNALANLSTLDETYGQQAIAEYPTHPRTLELLHQKLEKNPDNLDLQQTILTHHPTDSRTADVIQTLTSQQKNQLTPEQWQAIGDNYWHRRIYNQAIAPYQQAPKTPQNLYRLARAQQLSDLKAEAQTNYQTLITQFPDAPETAIALKRLATLVPPAEGVAYARQWGRQFPPEAPEALALEISLLEEFDANGADQVRQTLLDKHSASEPAANERWRRAKAFAQAGNITDAWQWAREIASKNPQSDVAPKAVFWIGKWAQQLNRPDDAKAAFESVVARYPQSYYAWRSAVFLGWPVGDFNSVRSFNPPVTLPDRRPLPPAGSPMFKELYRLGQDTEAIELFTAQTQPADATQPLGVNEGFTQALLKLTQQEYLQGINQILNLRNPQEPAQRQAWETLRQTPDYWQALFPFPYQEPIFRWSGKRQLNPFLVTALIRQESRFEKDIQSSAGATGLMQVMPSTAAWIAPQIDLKDYSLTEPEDNLNLGTWYFDHTHETYNNNSLLAVASYNAGPGNVSKWLKEFGREDPDEFVEKIPFPETKGYVEAVFGNYWNYMRIYDPEVARLMPRP